MPIYEYRCASCGHELESLQKFSDAPLSTCPACQASALVKKVSAAGFHLKGSGWYATDFRNAGKPPAKTEAKPGSDAKAPAAAGSDGPSSGDGGKSESTAESRAGSKSESKPESSAPSTAAPATAPAAAPSGTKSSS